MKISQIAKAAGVGVETIRYYQRRKLLAVPQPISGSTSQYDAHDLRTLRFIRRAKGLGFTLEEIRRLISLSETDCDDVLALATQKLALVRQKIVDLSRMETMLLEGVENCHRKGSHATCPILDSFVAEDGSLNG